MKAEKTPTNRRKLADGEMRVPATTQDVQEQAADQVEPKLPTPTELALIAAALARQTQQSARELAEQAMDLWTQSVHQICKADKRRAERVWAKVNADEIMLQIPMPKNFPVTLDKFLHLMLPKRTGRTGDKYATYRAYLIHFFTGMAEELGDRVEESELKDLVDAEFKLRMEEPMNAPDYAINAKLFLDWWPTYVSSQRSAAGRKGGQSTRERSLEGEKPPT